MLLFCSYSHLLFSWNSTLLSCTIHNFNSVREGSTGCVYILSFPRTRKQRPTQHFGARRKRLHQLKIRRVPSLHPPKYSTDLLGKRATPYSPAPTPTNTNQQNNPSTVMAWAWPDSRDSRVCVYVWWSSPRSQISTKSPTFRDHD